MQEQNDPATLQQEEPDEGVPQEDTTQDMATPQQTGNDDNHDPAEASTDDLQFQAPPPKAKSSMTGVESLAQLLLSEEHLNYVIQEPLLFTRFVRFLSGYDKRLVPIVLYHLECQKATKALEFANAVAANLGPLPGNDSSNGLDAAAAMNKELDERRKEVIDILTAEALPASITYGLVQVVTDTMSRSIQGRHQMPVMRNLISGMTEVFVLTDPSLEDNPIIFASEEFYRMTGYGRDYVIGRNCRFLQGPKTDKSSVNRLKRCIDDGVEISEALLNYRRDGTPFMNLLMVAPLHDNKGNVKYQIGAQVDVTGLVEEGQGLDGFDSFLVQRKRRESSKQSQREKDGKDLALEKLGQLSEMFDAAEAAIVRSSSRSNSMTRDSGYSSNYQRDKGNTRRILIDDSDDEEEEEDQTKEELEANANWKLAPPSAATGKLPGVYQKYLLIRPAPSMRVIFVSPGLRELGASLRKPFFDCISASRATTHGLQDAFKSGAPVTAKVMWNMPQKDSNEKRTKGPQKWISATPLLGGDEEVGVWMIVVVDGQSSHFSRETSVRATGTRDSAHMPETGPSPPPAEEATSNAEMDTDTHPEPDSSTKAGQTQEQEQEQEQEENERPTEVTTEQPPDDGVASLHDSKEFEASPTQDESERPDAAEQHTPSDEPKKSEASPPQDGHERLDPAEQPGSSLPEQEVQQPSEEADKARQEPEMATDLSSEVDDYEEHLPVSKTIWAKPPRPSAPSRTISID